MTCSPKNLKSHFEMVAMQGVSYYKLFFVPFLSWKYWDPELDDFRISKYRLASLGVFSCAYITVFKQFLILMKDTLVIAVYLAGPLLSWIFLQHLSDTFILKLYENIGENFTFYCFYSIAWCTTGRIIALTLLSSQILCNKVTCNQVGDSGLRYWMTFLIILWSISSNLPCNSDLL